MFCIWIFFISSAVKFSRSKTVEGSITPDTLLKKWNYLAKFGYKIGQGRWDFNAKLHDIELFENNNIYLACYLDEDWPRVLAAPTCEQKLDLARSRDLLYPEYSDPAYPATGGRIVRSQQRVSQHIRPHFWYFAWVVCTYNPDSHALNGSIDWNIHLFNDNSHFAVDQRGMWTVHLVILIIFILGGLFYLMGLSTFKKKYGKSVPSVLLLVAGILLMQLCSVILEFVHLTIYFNNGKGIMMLEYFGELFHVMGNVCTTTLFLMLSWGWNLQSLRIRRNSIGGQKLMIPGCTVTGFIMGLFFVHAILGICHQLEVKNDPHDIYHDHHSWTRISEIIMRIGFWIWFVAGTYHSSNVVGRDRYKTSVQQKRTKKLFRWLFILISAWFLVLPLSVLITYFIPEYYQALFISYVTLFIQSVILIALPLFFLNPNVHQKFRNLTASLT